MKRQPAHTVAWILLGAALLFNQVGLNFFHDRHDAHEFFSGSQKNQTILLNHGEHCQVCSLEVLFNVVLPVTTGIPQRETTTEFVAQVCPQPVLIFTALSQGRAPPFVA